jgi:g-D-glutamyl-meso-diaminopimelate peptidase
MTLTDIYTDIENLNNLPGVDLEIIGYSELGQPIYAAHIGDYEGDQMIIEGAIHAREYITALLLVEMVKYLHNQIQGFGIYFIPLVNPDGVQLVLEGADFLPQEKREFVLKVNNYNPDFSQWKANINAVDLNVNFNALWGGGAQNVTYPAPANFIGYEPNSESEVQTLIEFTTRVNPVLTLSYHTKGEVIYYGFEVLSQSEIARDLSIAQQIARTTGYLPVKTENSTGGYSDWVSDNLRVPAFTVEVGRETLSHPIPISYLPEIFEQNKQVPLVAYDALRALA